MRQPVYDSWRVSIGPGNFDEFWLPPALGTFEIVPS
jgi:hypothetical protein